MVFLYKDNFSNFIIRLFENRELKNKNKPKINEATVYTVIF